MLLSNEAIAIIGFLLGPVAKTLVDYLFKILDDPETVFKKAYWVTMMASMILSFIFALVECAAILANIPVGSQAYVFIACFAQGFMLNYLANKPASMIIRRRAP